MTVEIWQADAFAYTAPMFAQSAFRSRCASWLSAIGVLLLLGGCGEEPSTLERVQAEGVLRVVTR